MTSALAFPKITPNPIGDIIKIKQTSLSPYDFAKAKTKVVLHAICSQRHECPQLLIKHWMRRS
jgi:hypothetical protein